MKRQDVSGVERLAVDSVGGGGATDVNIASVGGTPVTSPLPVTVAAGSAVIGHVITDTGSTTAVTGNVTVVQGTGTNLHTVVDSGTITTLSTVTSITNPVISSVESGTIYNGTTALTPKFKAISASSNGNNTIVAAVGGKKIRVLTWNLMSSGSVNAKWQSAAGGTDLTGLYYLIANTGISVPFAPSGQFETVSGELLNLNLSAGTAVGGSLVYIEV